MNELSTPHFQCLLVIGMCNKEARVRRGCTSFNSRYTSFLMVCLSRMRLDLRTENLWYRDQNKALESMVVQQRSKDANQGQDKASDASYIDQRVLESKIPEK